MDRDKLKVQIWYTRITRAIAEERLIKKEGFIQFINIYYSLCAIYSSIYSFIKKDDLTSILSIIITIGLLVSILYLNGQKYTGRAGSFKAIYTEMQRLEMSLDNPTTDVEKVYNDYINLLKQGENHIEYDYYLAVRSVYKKEGKKELWDSIKYKFYWERAYRFVIKLIVLIMPIIIYFVCRWIF